MLHPAFRSLTIKVLCALFSARDQSHDKVYEWLMKLGEVTGFGNPMVHLHIDVSMVVSVPWGEEGV